MQSAPPDGKNITYVSDDAAVIQTWVALLKKMKTSPRAFESVTGYGFALTLYEGEKEINIGGFVLPYIYNTTNETMNFLDNHAALEEEFESAKKRSSIEPK